MDEVTWSDLATFAQARQDALLLWPGSREVREAAQEKTGSRHAARTWAERTAPGNCSFATLLDHGWTTESFAALTALAEHACTVGVPWCSTDQGGVVRTARMLAARGEIAAQASATFAEIQPWLRLAASEPNGYRSLALWVGIDKWALGDEPPDDAPSTWAAAMGERAALAWAAGLSYTEAIDRHATGDLDPVVLAAMAALRGIRYPDGHRKGGVRERA